MVVFLDEEGDFPPAELLLKVEELVEIESAGDGEEAGGGDAV